MPGKKKGRCSVILADKDRRDKKENGQMKKRTVIAWAVFLMVMMAVLPASAANVFRFSAESIRVFEGETVTPELLRDGSFAEGEVVYTARNGNASVDENGVITGVKAGQVYVQADLMRDGKSVRNTSILVTVVLNVQKVELLPKGVQIFEAGDETILPQLPAAEGTETDTRRIAVMAAGRGFYPRVAFTPDNVQNKRYTTTTSNSAVAKMTSDGQVIGVAPGECELTITSALNPAVSETLRLVVTQPVKRVEIQSDSRKLPAGKTMQLGTAVTPENATIQLVTWNSRNPKIATVDANGLVTGIARGDVVIEAKTTDGSNLTATLYLTVTQDVTEIRYRKTDVTVSTGRSVKAEVDVLPANASDKGVLWSSSDETIATVNQYGNITGRKAGDCTVTCTSRSNPEVSADLPVHVIQPVTGINFLNPKGLSFHIGDSRQLNWEVLPADATIQDVTFRSRNPKVAAVDQNGIVTGLAKGEADIEVKAADGSNVTRTFRVSILKAVEGINPLNSLYFAQINGAVNIKATVYPNDASNQRIQWSSGDESVATIRSVGTSYGRIYGQRAGWVTITATTEDGGFSCSTNVAVNDFDGMILVTNAYIDENNRIRLTLWNMSQDFGVNKVWFRVDCYDTQGEPMICNMDGESTSFDGEYPLSLDPGGQSMHGQFTFRHYQPTGPLGYVVITVTGFQFETGQDWWIPEEKQVHQPSMFSPRWGEPTETETDTEEETHG